MAASINNQRLMDNKTTTTETDKMSIAYILKAQKILSTVTAVSNGPLKFLNDKKLFSGTALDNSSVDNKIPQSLRFRVPTIQCNEILRKNIYFLARKTIKVKNLCIQLTQQGVINFDHKDKIFLHSTEELLMACEMYAVLVTLENLVFDNVLGIFRHSENAHISDLLVSRMADMSTLRSSSSLPKPSSIPAVHNNNNNKTSWSCPHCTFLNTTESLMICSLCSKSRNCPLNDEDHVDESVPTSLISDFGVQDFNFDNSKICAFCTLINPENTQFCSACNNPLG